MLNIIGNFTGPIHFYDYPNYGDGVSNIYGASDQHAPSLLSEARMELAHRIAEWIYLDSLGRVNCF